METTFSSNQRLPKHKDLSHLFSLEAECSKLSVSDYNAFCNRMNGVSGNSVVTVVTNKRRRK